MTPFLKCFELLGEPREWQLIPGDSILTVTKGDDLLHAPEGAGPGYCVIYADTFEDTGGCIGKRRIFGKAWCSIDDWEMFLRGDTPPL